MIKRLFTILMVSWILLIMTGISMEVNSADVTLSYEVQAINELTITGSPNLSIVSATAGSEPDDATSSGSYDITTNQSSVNISAYLDSAITEDVNFYIEMTAPSTGTSAGKVDLTHVTNAGSVNLVTNIANVAETDLPITYTLSTTADTGSFASLQKTITFTISN